MLQGMILAATNVLNDLERNGMIEKAFHQCLVSFTYYGHILRNGVEWWLYGGFMNSELSLESGVLGWIFQCGHHLASHLH